MTIVYPTRHVQKTGQAHVGLCGAVEDGRYHITVLMPTNADCPACLALMRVTGQTIVFDDLLASLLDMDAPYGFVCEVEGDETSLCWFASARNAASWISHQSPERLGTQYEYKVRVATEEDKS